MHLAPRFTITRAFVTRKPVTQGQGLQLPLVTQSHTHNVHTMTCTDVEPHTILNAHTPGHAITHTASKLVHLLQAVA